VKVIQQRRKWKEALIRRDKPQPNVERVYSGKCSIIALPVTGNNAEWMDHSEGD
jgi:hypothetical protein